MRPRLAEQSRTTATALAAVALISMMSYTERPPLGFGPGCAFAQTAQQTPPDTVPSVLLLKRLAEAVDGTRTGAQVWVVGSYAAPHRILGTFETRATAQALADSAGGWFRVFGPYLTQRDPGKFVAWLSRCEHDGRTSVMDSLLGRTSICPEIPVFRLDDVDGVTISFRLRGTPDVQTIPVRPGTDAVFFTLSALDKFVFPYYVRILGVEETSAMRERIIRRMSP